MVVTSATFQQSVNCTLVDERGESYKTHVLDIYLRYTEFD